MLARIAGSRRLQLGLLAVIILCILVSLLSFRTFPLPRDSWLTSPNGPGPSHNDNRPPFYDWHTRSEFRPTQQENVDNKTVEELCAGFPTHLLNEVQPVLKTGHGVLDSRVRPHLLSVSACLSNLLILSDIDEQFMDHDIIDVFAEIPPKLLEDNKQVRAYWEQRELADQGELEGANLTRLEGWKIDKFKFLAQVSLAWRMRPDRRWYVFYEADTYLVWDNIFRLLEQFDADAPLYFGSPSPGREGTWFANGGPGAILSRGAVKKLVEKDWSEQGDYLGSMLTEREWYNVMHDCCGDSILGWALHNVGVHLSGLWPMFNPHPLHGVPFSDLYWCQPVLTMHKPHEEDVMGLWRWEESRREVQRPLLYRDLIEFTGVLEEASRDDWDNGGWDGFKPPERSPSGIDPNESFEACGKACEEHSKCLQWNYHLKGCWFVRSIRLGVAREPMVEKWRSKEIKAKDWSEEEMRFMAGWAVEKARKWADERQCEKVQWVTPSTKRIF